MKEVLKVEWIDSAGGSGWEFLAEYTGQAARCTTYGFLIREDDESISIAQTYAKETVKAREQIDNDVTIPKCAILSIYEVLSSGLELVLERPLQGFSLSQMLSDHEEPGMPTSPHV